MGLKAERVVYSDDAEDARGSLERSKKPEHGSILRRIGYLEQRLLEDCQAGEVIPLPLSKRARAIERRHAPLQNLYCCDLPSYWRLLYTIVRDGPIRIVYILEIVDHPTYDRWFKGRGR